MHICPVCAGAAATVAAPAIVTIYRWIRRKLHQWFGRNHEQGHHHDP